MNVILLGMKHCGKSTLGVAMAQKRGCPFYDVDDLIETIHQCRSGQYMSVREIFRQAGPEEFVKIEALALIELGKILEQPGAAGIVALGGRTATNERARHILGHMGLKVYLKVDADVLFERVLAGGLPPFLDESDPRGSFLRLFEERRSAYESLADLTVDLDGLDQAQALVKLERAIEEHTNAG